MSEIAIRKTKETLSISFLIEVLFTLITIIFTNDNRLGAFINIKN